MQVTTCRISLRSSQAKEGNTLKENQDCFATGCCDVSSYSGFTQARGSTMPKTWHSVRASVLHTAKVMDPILQDTVPMRQKMMCSCRQLGLLGDFQVC